MRLRRNPACAYRALGLLLLAAAPFTLATAAENSGCLYPIGAETVMPGLVPASGQTMLAEFSNFYQANSVVDSNGHSLVPGFHLRVSAVAVKVVHNWGVHALGGTLVSWGALPVLYEHLDTPMGRSEKTGIGNPDLGILDVAYAKGSWHWWYGVESFAPGAQYTKGDALNVGQHYFGVSPDAAVTYLPDHGKDEFSSKIQYIDNFTDPATHYRSGHELIWEYTGMHNVTRQLAVGVNGYFYHQMTDDRQNGLAVAGGDRGQTLGVGPQVRYHLAHMVLIAKFEREVLVQNRTAGNSFWFEFGLPLGRHE